MPKLLSLLLCFAMVFSLLALPAQAAKADASSVDGTYTGTGTGRNGDITLSVTIADGKITQIENVSNKETPKYWAEAVKLFDSILAANGTDGVDAVSGATLSSDGASLRLWTMRWRRRPHSSPAAARRRIPM